MLSIKSLTVLLASVVLVTSDKNSYSGYKVFEIQHRNESETNLLHELYQIHTNVDFWRITKRVGDAARVLVPPNEQSTFLAALDSKGLQYRELVIDFQRTTKENHHPVPKNSTIGESILLQYLRQNEIDLYLDQLAAAYPSRVQVQQIGTSYEGLPLKTITITSEDGPGQKPIVFVDAGIHAREWIAPSTALYIIQQLVEHPDDNDSALLDKINWVILPLVNPDGYEFSHTDERYWRKTRSQTTVEGCFGTDANRNFEYHWAEVGASSDPCSIVHHGATPFSEPETRAIRNELLRLKGQCKFYLTLHSYGRYLLYPWGWTSMLPSTVSALHEVAEAGFKAISEATGSNYTVGTSTNVLYAAAGGSDDWAYAEAAVPISITMELPAGGDTGFDPEPAKIDGFVKESWIGIKAMALKVAELYPTANSTVSGEMSTYSGFSILLVVLAFVQSIFY